MKGFKAKQYIITSCFFNVQKSRHTQIFLSFGFFEFLFFSFPGCTHPVEKSHLSSLLAVAPRTPNRSVTPLRFQSYLLDATEVWRPQGGLRSYISPRQGGNRPTIFNQQFAYFFHIHVEGDMDLMYIYICSKRKMLPYILHVFKMLDDMSISKKQYLKTMLPS